MKLLQVFIFLISIHLSAQTDTLTKISFEADTLKQPIKWPYVNNQTIEIGTAINLSDNYSYFKGGMTLGPSLTYKRYIEKSINAIEFDLGFYSLLTFGIGTNYNFSTTDDLLAFKPFIGTTFYHFQLTYGYNFFSDKRNDNFKLNHNCIKLRLMIPIHKLFNG
jgi:hypothetical protein